MDKCIICGCIKDGAQYIEKVFDNISKIQTIFKDTRIIVAYDKSTDNTLEILRKLQHRFDLTIIINNKPLTPIRTLNIANARNSIIEVINEKYRDYNYFIMIDLDDVCFKKINIDALTDGLKDKDEWDALFFNNENYYDFWALSFDNFEYSCWHSNNPKLLINIMNEEFKKKINKTDKYISCKSAFGGFGIYKTSKFINCKYKTVCGPNERVLFNFNSIINICKKYNIKYIINNSNIYDCEHRHFHLSAIHKNNVILKISKQCLFPKYKGEHTNILWNN